MRIRILVLCLAWEAGLCGQHRFSWQDACFKNPGAPYCPGHDVAVKRARDGSRSGATNQQPLPVTPLAIVAGGIDWRFADPFADALAGFNFSKLSSSPLARGLIAQLGSNQGLTEADITKIFEGLTRADQVALSVRDNRIVFMVTSRATDSAPVLAPGWKAVPVGANAMLIGHAEAVDQAVQRIATDDPPVGLMQLAEERRSSSEFWAVGSAALTGPQAMDAGVNGFSLAISIQERLTSDLAFEFNRPPDVNTIRTWPLTHDAAIKTNMVLARVSMEAGQIPERFGPIAASPLVLLR